MKKATYREIPALLEQRKPFDGNSCHAFKYDNCYEVWSYYTLILKEVDGEVMYFDSDHYSSTTSKLQNILRRVFNLK